MHEIKPKDIIGKRLKAKNLDPDAPATIKSNDELQSFTEEMNPASLKKTGNVAMYLVDSLTNLDGSSAYGETIPTQDMRNVLRINISKSALSSWRLAASTVGHELNHVYHFVSGAYSRWYYSKGGGEDYAHAKSEYIAQAWEQINGGVPTNSLMMKMFNVMQSFNRPFDRK